LRFRADGNLSAQFKITGVRARGSVDGHLDLIYTNSGLHYSAGLEFDGSVQVWNALFQRWDTIGSVSNIGLGISNDRLTLSAQGYSFSMDLPH
jgi:hypothetical protein